MIYTSPEYNGKPGLIPPGDYCHPHHRIPNDVEHAFVVPPGHECCPDDEPECVCVTSGDVANWNQAYETVSGISPEDWAKFASGASAYGEIASSADKWNETYGLVQEGKPRWDQISAFEMALTSACDELTSAINRKADSFAVDENSIIGDGTSGHPYGVRDYEKLFMSRELLNSIIRHFKQVNDENYPQVITLAQSSAYSGYNVPFPAKEKDPPWISDAMAWWVDAFDYRFNDSDKTDASQWASIEHNWSAIQELWKRIGGYGSAIAVIEELVKECVKYQSGDYIKVTKLTDEEYKIDLSPSAVGMLNKGVSAYDEVNALKNKIVEYKWSTSGANPDACVGNNIIWFNED